MDVDKLKKWLDVAQQFQGENFWSDIFDNSEQQVAPNNQAARSFQSANHTQKQTGTDHRSEKSQSDQSQSEIMSSYDQHQASQQQKTGHLSQDSIPSYKPSIDIFETPTEWVILIDLPGVKKQDIQLNLVGRELIIKGEAGLPFPKETLIHSERLNGQFERSIRMPENLSLDAQPLAKYQQNILEVRLPRKQPRRHQINID